MFRILFIFTIATFIGVLYASKSTNTPVTFYSIIKLRHAVTKYYLHSHEIQYGSGSGQQSVTAVPSQSDPNSYWIVLPPFKSKSESVNNEEYTPGTIVKSGTTIRLKHVNTGLFLHSHKHRSPITGQQEVSCLDPQNTGDNWILHLESDKNGNWNKGDKVRLLHADTNMYLHSHKHYFQNPIPGQQEVTGFQTKTDSQNTWIVEEGVLINPESA